VIRKGLTAARNAFSDGLVRASAWLFAGFLTTGVFNYGFQVAMGRLLGPSDYGLMNALLGLCVVLGVPTATLSMVLARKTAGYRATGDIARARRLFQRANEIVWRAGLPGLAVLALASGAIAVYLKAPSRTPVLILGGVLLSSVAYPTSAAILQGLREYGWFGILQGLAGPARFFFCVLAVLAGLGLDGALLGMLAANAVLWGLAYFPARNRLASVPASPTPDPVAWGREMSVLAANLAFAVMTQADLVLVKHYFPAPEAGMYASAAILGRTVMYIPGSLVLAMFPMAVERKALNLDGRPLLFKALLMTLVLSGAGAALFFLAPHWVLETFFGVPYAGAAGLLKYFGPAMLPMAFLLVVFNHEVAHGGTVFPYVMLAGAVVEIVLIHSFHGSLMSVVMILAAVGAALCGLGLIRWRAPRPEPACGYEFA